MYYNVNKLLELQIKENLSKLTYTVNLLENINKINMANEQDDNRDKEFLETIVKYIVSKPDEVQVERKIDEMGVLLTLKVDPEDMGFVIGRRGQTAQAIRNLLKIVGARNNSRVNLKIYDPNAEEGGERKQNSSSEQGQEEVDTSSVDDLNL